MAATKFRYTVNLPCSADLPRLDLLAFTTGGEIVPAHFPLLSNLKHLPVAMIIFLRWWNFQHHKGIETGLLLHLEPRHFIDPPLLLPPLAKICLLTSKTVKSTVASYTDALQMFYLEEPTTEMELIVFRKNVYQPVENRYHRILMNLHKRSKHIPRTNLLVDTKRRCTEKVSVGLELLSTLNINMMIIAWNTRGIARTSFKRNFLYLFHNHHPDIFILTETRVSITNTEKIMEGLPFENRVLMEPDGFTGGVLIIWNSRVDFEVGSQNKQGIHDIVQLRSSFFLYVIPFSDLW